MVTIEDEQSRGCRKQVDEGGGALKNRVITCVGLSSTVLIGVLTLWGGLPFTSLTGLDIADILKYWTTPLQFVLGLTLVSVIIRKRPPADGFLLASTVLSGLFIIAGFVILGIGGKYLQQQVLLVAGAAAAVGIGYGLLLLLWLHQLSLFTDSDIIKLLLVSLATSSVMYLILQPLFLGQLACFAAGLIVALSVVLCMIAARLPSQHPDQPQNALHKSTLRKVFLELRDPLYCVCAIAVAVALTRFIALEGVENPDVVNTTASIGAIVVCAVLYLIWFGLGKDHPLFGKQNILWLYRVLFPAIATALVLLSIFGNTLGLAVTTLVYIAFSIVSVFIMSTSITLARKYQMWAPHVYGMFAACMYFVFTIATALGPWVYFSRNFGTATLSIIVLLVLYVLAMSYVAVQNRRKRDTDETKSETSENTPPTTAETTVVDEVAQRCTILTELHKLTGREQEVMLLIARGRDVPSISKQLFISENTVRSHSKNVYRKLDIHSKQELLDLLETVELNFPSKEEQLSERIRITEQGRGEGTTRNALDSLDEINRRHDL